MKRFHKPIQILSQQQSFCHSDVAPFCQTCVSICSANRASSMAWNKSGSSWTNWNPNNSWGSWSDSHKNSWDQSQPESKWDQTKPSASITQTPVPSDFQADEEFLDNCEKYGYKLHRKVQPTNWSRKRQLAGRPVEDISIVDITKNGWEEHALRVLSQGSFVTPVWARSTSEAVFAAGLFKKMNMPSTS